jgi:hypothetical protein
LTEFRRGQIGFRASFRGKEVREGERDLLPIFSTAKVPYFGAGGPEPYQLPKQSTKN